MSTRSLRESSLGAVVLGVLALALASACQTRTTQVNGEPWSTDAAVAMLDSGDCASFWPAVWPRARAGNSDAQLLLADAIYHRGFTPPGAGTDARSRLRSAMALYAEVSKHRHPHARAQLAGLLRAQIFEETGGEEHAQCLEYDDDDTVSCVDSALASGLFPEFKAWAATLDAFATKHGPHWAACDGATESQRLDDSDFDIRPPSG